MQSNNNSNTNNTNNGEGPDLISFVSARFVGDEDNDKATVVNAQVATTEPERFSSFYGSAIQVSASDVAAAPITNASSEPAAPRPDQIVVAPLRPGQNNHLPVAQATPLPASHVRRAGYRKRKELPPRVRAFKERRQVQQATAAVAGGVVGAIVLGPIGAVLGAAVAHGTTKRIGRRRQARLERSIAAEANAASSAGVI